jgi:hypothetical protein
MQYDEIVTLNCQRLVKDPGDAGDNTDEEAKKIMKRMRVQRKRKHNIFQFQDFLKISHKV